MFNNSVPTLGEIYQKTTNNPKTNIIEAIMSKDIDLIPNFGWNDWTGARNNAKPVAKKDQGGHAGVQSPDASASVNTGSVATTYNAPNYAAQNANAIAQLEQSANTIQNAMNRLGGQLGIAHGNIDRQFGQRDNELNTQRASNENSYNTSSTQNQQSLRTNKNTITDQASNGLRGLMRMLGSQGAVGSDLKLAGTAVADQASAQNSGASQTYAQNQQALDTNWGNYKNEWENEKKKVNDWRTQQRDAATAQSEASRQDLLSRLADMRGQISAARGGSYAQSAQPYLDQANSLNARIDELGRINPTYTGNTPQYQAATLDSYDTGRGTAATASQNGVAGGLNTPYLNMILGRDRERRQTV